MNHSPSITLDQRLSVEEFLRLRSLVGFQPLTPEQAETVLHHTACVVTARCGPEAVGCVRLLFDYGTDAYLTDVIVHPDYQGCGIGAAMVAQALAHIRANAVPGVRVACTLYANKGKEPFYEKFGFQRLPNTVYGYGMILEIP